MKLALRCSPGGTDADVGLPGKGAEARIIAAHNAPLGGLLGQRNAAA